MKIFNKGKEIKYESFIFPGGEEHIRIIDEIESKIAVIQCIIKSSSDLIKLLLVTDALKRMYVNEIWLFMPYIPYARQDRVCNKGESLSIKVFSDIINSQKYHSVCVLDPHSIISTVLIDNIVEMDIGEIIKENIEIDDDFLIICPDNGAAKKYGSLYKKLGNTIVFCDKQRDLLTGKITNIDIKCNDFKDRKCLIIDDICDGGGTFIGIANILKERGAKQVDLYVSHGIFSKGLDVFNNIIDNIYCCTLFNESLKKDNKLNYIDILRSFI
jgi:ribose-phosphate pyrophosphokinase